MTLAMAERSLTSMMPPRTMPRMIGTMGRFSRLRIRPKTPNPAAMAQSVMELRREYTPTKPRRRMVAPIRRDGTSMTLREPTGRDRQEGEHDHVEHQERDIERHDEIHLVLKELRARDHVVDIEDRQHHRGQRFAGKCRAPGAGSWRPREPRCWRLPRRSGLRVRPCRTRPGVFDVFCA